MLMVNKFDRLKIIAPLDCIKSLDTDSNDVLYRPTVNKSREIESESWQVLGNKHYGIRRTAVNAGRNEVTIDFSAKILLDDYNKLVSINNIQQCLNRYSEATPLKLNVQKFMDSAKVINCDTTQMIYPDYDINLCTDSLMMYDTKDRCQVTRYFKKQNSGIEFNASIQKEKRRLILYDKHSSIMKGLKSTNIFLTKCRDPQAIIDACRGSLRVEQTHSSLKSIRNRFKITENSLVNVLHSVQSVNYNFFESVERKQKQPYELGYQFDLFEHADKSILDVVKEVGYRGIVAMCDYDIEKIKSVFRSYSDEKSSRYNHLKKCRSYLKIMLEEQFQKNYKGQTSDKINNHIFELIKVA
jgi:hypothetical protein|tara:strand:+ start:659 stop:1723 length:1065 start_codon:yes stop_codon:yes gene_type:complete